MWVTSQRADRYTCPSATCGVVGQLFFRVGLEVMEKRDKYVRVTKRYDAACKSGKSENVDSGRADCVAENGITDGKFAEWVLMSLLSDDRPADPAATASASEQFVAQSDDFGVYRSAFVKAADALIADGSCTGQDFTANGGWIKSMKQKGEPVYFTYCGTGSPKAQWYLNASTGRTYQK